MKWYFVRFYLGIVVVLLIAAGIFYIFAHRANEREVDQRYERFWTPWVDRVREKLAEVPAEEVPEEIEDRSKLIEEIEYRPSFLSSGERRRRRPPPTRLVKRDELVLPRVALERLDNGEVVAFRNGDERLVYAAVAGGDVAVIGAFSRRGRDRDDDTASNILNLLAPSLGILILIGIAIYLLIRPIERRISSLSQVTRSFGAGALDARAQVGRTSTVNELEESFNAMAARIEELIDGQKELLKAVSHDLRTPLARVFFALDDAQAAGTPEEKNTHLKRIDRSMVELNDLVEELTAYLHLDERGSRPAKEWTDVSHVLQHAGDLVADLRKEISLEVSCDESRVFAEPRYLKRAVGNLVTNAIAHAEKGVWITCRSVDGAFVLCVDDDGPGIPEEEREKVFEPFYRREPSRNMDLGGSGLGLAIVARIMAAHGGSAGASQSPRGGARFTLSFPGEEEDSSPSDEA